jgi:hypothetical protein
MLSQVWLWGPSWSKGRIARHIFVVDFDRLCKLEKRGDEIKKKSSPLKLLSQSHPNFAEMILGWSPSKIVSGISYLRLSNWFQTKRFLCEFPIGSYVKLSSAVGAILVKGPNRRTYFWKRTIQWMILGWSPSKIVSGISDLRPRWPPHPNLI